MLENDKARFAAAIGSCALIFGKAINAELISALWSVLVDQPIENVEQAILAHAKTGQYFPVPVDIIKHIPQVRRINVPLLAGEESIPMSHRKVLR